MKLIKILFFAIFLSFTAIATLTADAQTANSLCGSPANGAVITVNHNCNMTILSGRTVTIQNGTITGTIIVQQGAILNMTGGAITGAGRAVVVNAGGTFNMTGGRIHGNTGSDSHSDGGAIYLTDGTATNRPRATIGGSAIIENNNFAITTASQARAGGIRTGHWAYLIVEGNAQIRNNRAGGQGAGIGVNGNDTTVRLRGNARIHNNVTTHGTSGNGAGIYFGGQVSPVPSGRGVRNTLIITDNVQITNNSHTLSYGWGSAIFFRFGGTFRMYGGLISGNNSWTTISLRGTSTVHIENATISNNTARHYGSALHMTGGGNVTLRNVHIYGNNSSHNTNAPGGALFFENVGAPNGGQTPPNVNFNVTIENSTINNNTGTNMGTAVNAQNRTLLTIRNTIFQANRMRSVTQSTDGGAIAIVGANSTLTVSDSHFIDNAAHRNGGAIFTAAGLPVTITNTIFDGNTANNGGALYLSPTFNAVSLPANAFTNVTIHDNVHFRNNVARHGNYHPPLNWENFQNIQSASVSTPVDSIINNADLNFRRPSNFDFNKMSKGDSGNVSEVLRYIIAVTNTTSTATSFTIRDTLDLNLVSFLEDSLTVDNASNSSNSFNYATGLLTVTVNIPPLTTSYVSFYVTPLLGAAGRDLRNVAYLYNAQNVRIGNSVDTIFINEFEFPDEDAWIPTVPEISQPTISAASSHNPVQVGEIFEYHVTVTNHYDGILSEFVVQTTIDQNYFYFIRDQLKINNQPHPYSFNEETGELRIYMSELTGYGTYVITFANFVLLKAAEQQIPNTFDLSAGHDDQIRVDQAHYLISVIDFDLNVDAEIPEVDEILLPTITIQANNPNPRIGERVSYVLVVTNENEETFYDFQVRILIDHNLLDFEQGNLRLNGKLIEYYLDDNSNEIIVSLPELTGDFQQTITFYAVPTFSAENHDVGYAANLYWQSEKISRDVGSKRVRPLERLRLASHFDTDVANAGQIINYTVSVSNPNSLQLYGRFIVVTEIDLDKVSLIENGVKVDGILHAYTVDYENRLLIVELKNKTAGATVLNFELQVNEDVYDERIVAITWIQVPSHLAQPDDAPPAAVITPPLPIQTSPTPVPSPPETDDTTFDDDYQPLLTDESDDDNEPVGEFQKLPQTSSANTTVALGTLFLMLGMASLVIKNKSIKFRKNF